MFDVLVDALLGYIEDGKRERPREILGNQYNKPCKTC
jgi:hypothetical protein